VRLPLNVRIPASKRACHHTLTAPYYGWVLVGALGVTEVISWGVLYYAFSVFLTPMEIDLGWSRGETTGGLLRLEDYVEVYAWPSCWPSSTSSGASLSAAN
jgi:hypothetical protein